MLIYLLLNGDNDLFSRNHGAYGFNQIISKNASRKVIIVTHDSIDPEGNRLVDLSSFGMDGVNKKGNPKGNNANTLYKKLIKDDPNVLLILCGHKSGEFEKALMIKKSEDSEEKKSSFRDSYRLSE